jgi:RNA polymerase sigma factor (sigma-70 family)
LVILSKIIYSGELGESLSDIINECIEGNSIAQEKLYKRFAGKMFAVCLQYAGDYDEAKDVLQEGFIRVFSNLKQFKKKGSFEGWIRRIMINTALEKYRDKFYLNRVENQEENIEVGVDDKVFEDLSAQDLLKMIRKLSPKYRMVFNLYAIEGYSHKEISALLNISEGTSKSNLSRARAILQEKLKLYYKITKVI